MGFVYARYGTSTGIRSSGPIFATIDEKNTLKYIFSSFQRAVTSVKVTFDLILVNGKDKRGILYESVDAACRLHCTKLNLICLQAEFLPPLVRSKLHQVNPEAIPYFSFF